VLTTRSTSGAQYDLLVKGGRVIDPSSRLDRIADVAIAKGRIAAVQPSIPASAAADVVDASGALVTPGLIDIHTHVRSAEMPGICLSQGVTSLVDAGSRGADMIDSVVGFAKGAPNRVRVLVNLSRAGVIDEGDLMDLSLADVALARQAILKHRDVVIGVKARLSRNVVGEHDLEALRRAQEVTRPLGLPVMIHIGQGFSTIPQLLELLKPGDIVTHMYAFPPNSIFDGKGGVLPEVIAARRRGIRFDVGNGRAGHFTWDTMAEGIKAGFLPDTTSSDWTDAGRAEHVVDLPNVMSKLLMLAVPLPQVIAMVTSNAAATFPAFKGLGTLRVGAPADVSILELREGSFDFIDNVNTKRTGRQRLFLRAAIMGGKRFS
jgi:dihydroorotase